MEKLHLTISVVLYKNDPAEITKLLDCIAQTTLQYKIYLIDNSPGDGLKLFSHRVNTEYIFNNHNAGFGQAQNIAIEKAKGKSKYHLILNPDISFENGTLENIYSFMEANMGIGQVMPKIFYEDGTIQKLCKLLPHPADLIGRRFFGNASFMQKRNSVYELEGFNYNKILDTPNLSGCFMFIRTAILEKISGFDQRYFMYLEDIDLTRRVNKISRTVFYPGAAITHGFNKGSYSNPLLLKYHIASAIKYFNKWGWFFDKERTMLNKKVLTQVQEL
jgi:GT2 family glycosyltransferase